MAVVRARDPDTAAFTYPPGPQRRFTPEEVAMALDVPKVTVQRWIDHGWLRARRVFWDWRTCREPSGYTIRGSAVAKALEHPNVVIDMLERKTRVEMKRAREGGHAPLATPRPNADPKAGRRRTGPRRG